MSASSPISIERLTVVNDEFVSTLARLWPQLTDGVAPGPEAISRVLDDGAIILVARRDGQIVGMGTLVMTTVLTGITAHIEDVVVDAAYRDRGIGERLVRELISIADQNGAEVVCLTSHPSREAANRLYQRIGFEKGSTNYYSLVIPSDPS